MDKKYILVILFFFICISRSFAQSGWIPVNSGTTQTLNAVHFMNANTGLVVGNNGTILKTTNAGFNWSSMQSPPPGIQSFFDIFFDVTLDGHMVDDRDGIYETTNAGTNWNQQNAMTASPLNGIVFKDGNTGWVCGNNNTVRFTTNGGVNWLSPPPPPIPADFFDPGSLPFSGTIFLGGSPIGNTTGLMERTTNLGYNWDVPFQGPVRINDIEFANPTTGFACGPGETIVRRTTNGGTNWNPVTVPIEIVSLSLVSTTPITVYGCGTGGRVIKSTDAGNTWTVQQTPVTDSFFDIFFPFDALKGYVVGGNGRILMTTTGGVTFVKQINNEMPDRFALFQNYPNPFNPNSKIKFQIPRISYTKVIVYDQLGLEIVTLVDKQLKPGTYEVEFDGSSYPSGVYFYKLETEGFKETRKMVLMK